MTNAEPISRPRTEAVPFDHALRYMVPSARSLADKYLVELDSYDANGACCCKHFLCRLEPILKLGIPPAQAVKEGMIKLKENRHVDDALRCEHILTARSQFCDDVVRAIHHADKKSSPPPKR